MVKLFRLRFFPSEERHTFQFANPFFEGYFQLRMKSVPSEDYEVSYNFTWKFIFTYHNAHGELEDREFSVEILDACAFERYRDVASSHSFMYDHVRHRCANNLYFECRCNEFVLVEIAMSSAFWKDVPVRQNLVLDELSCIQFRK